MDKPLSGSPTGDPSPSPVAHTPGPWFFHDFRASQMRKLGWKGPAVDRILITNQDGPEIKASSGMNCVIARIQFDNRPEPLGDNNLADARLIAAAPDMLLALRLCERHHATSPHIGLIRAAIAKATGETP